MFKKERNMRFLVLVLLVLMFVSGSVVKASAGRRYGIIDDDLLGCIAGTDVNKEKYDYVLLFKLRKNPRLAMSEIQFYINSMGDELWKIGTLDDVIVVTIQSNYRDNSVFAKYSRATHYASLSRVYTQREWINSQTVQSVLKGKQDIDTLIERSNSASLKRRMLTLEMERGIEGS